MYTNDIGFLTTIKSFILLILFSFTITAGAQEDIEYIKRSGNYWYAEGNGLTIEDANKDALSQIIQQITVSISSDMHEVNDVVQHSDGSESIVYKQKSVVNSNSFATLKDVKMTIIKYEPDAVVFRWVSKDQVEKMFQERKSKILDFIETGKLAEQDLQIDDALRYYYWALVLARSNRDPVMCSFGGKESNCLSLLPLKIKSVISQIKSSVTSSTEDNGRYHMNMHFTYNGKDVSSLQLRYFDGQSFIGPLVARDGEATFDLVSLPTDNKVKMAYEYKFRSEAESLDAELKSLFSSSGLPTVDNTYVEVAMNDVGAGVRESQTNSFSEKEMPVQTSGEVMTQQTNESSIAAEPVKVRKRMELATVDKNEAEEYMAILGEVEAAIKNKNTESVYGHFTEEGYRMFSKFVNKTGNVLLVGKDQPYEFVKANGQVLARFCKVKVKFKNGKSFMEKIVFRFDEKQKKIQSLAFALTKKAEDDIFNASSKWTELSRYVILQFMEDYQTAYALQRLDYISKIFSDDAIIITGTVLKTASNNKPRYEMEGETVDFGYHKNIRYIKRSKQEFLETLKKHFNEREYVHLTFEDNITRVINAPRMPMGTAFGIQISQLYESPVYSDKGYLTLVLDTSGELPIIHVRLWQPERSDLMDLDEFISKFNF